MIKILLGLIVLVLGHNSNQDLRVTFVTGLWNVARGDMIIFKRSFDYYLSYFQDILKISDNVIIFGDAQLKSFVQENRKHKDNILFIDTTLKDIEKFWYTPKIWGVINETKKDWLKWQKYSVLPQFGLPMYNPVVMSKMKLIAEASKVDPFNSDYYVWIDGGLTHSFNKQILEEGTFIKIARNYQVDWLVQTGKGLPYHPFEIGFKNQARQYTNITDNERFYVWANWLGGKASAATSAYHIFQNFLRITLQNGDMNTDEGLLFLMLERYRYLFHRVVNPDTLGALKDMIVPGPIVTQKYSLRVINASELIKQNSLRIEKAQTCAQPLKIKVKYDVKDVKQFVLVSKSSKICLVSRILILIVLVMLRILYDKKVRKSEDNFILLKQEQNE